ncbi:MAG: hypothetical protein OEQ39_28775 [Gammaproteobacteria bacterium]|nr:hypothetical protein [Gammaproteobacteria bacterium]
MKKLALIIIPLFSIGCGGGGSSSGGGTAATGTYGGTATITMSVPGVASETATGAMGIEVRADGTVALIPAMTGFSGSAGLNGNSFTIDVPASQMNEPGLMCQGTIRFAGTIAGNTITGRVAGLNFRCNGVPFTLTGTYTLQRTGPARALSGSTLGNSIREAISTMR